MAVIFIRSSLIYIALLIIMRLMGKRQIGEMQPFEFTVTLLIAELACIPMSDFSIPLLYGISAILAMFILHQFMALLDKSGKVFKFLLSGKPSIVINRQGVDFNELKKNNLDVQELIESMRILGYFSLDSVFFAVYEANGTLSALENDGVDFSPSMPIAVIKNGKLDEKNLEIANLERKDLIEILDKNDIKNLKSVGVFTIDEHGRYYLQEYNKKYITGYVK